MYIPNYYHQKAGHLLATWLTDILGSLFCK